MSGQDGGEPRSREPVLRSGVCALGAVRWGWPDREGDGLFGTLRGALRGPLLTDSRGRGEGQVRMCRQ